MEQVKFANENGISRWSWQSFLGIYPAIFPVQGAIFHAQAIKASTEELRKHMKEVNISELEDNMDDLSELLEDTNEITEVRTEILIFHLHVVEYVIHWSITSLTSSYFLMIWLQWQILSRSYAVDEDIDEAELEGELAALDELAFESVRPNLEIRLFLLYITVYASGEV
jgi:hypothetical protein